MFFKEFQWRLIKLKEQNLISDKQTIFVETKFVGQDLNATEGFWAVDDVKVCHENGKKIIFIQNLPNI